jgi:putrescine aminotransferase
VSETRGEGLLVGVDFHTAEAATEFLIALLDECVIPSYSLNSSNVLRLTPPAVLTDHDLTRLERALDRAAATLGRTLGAVA